MSAPETADELSSLVNRALNAAGGVRDHAAYAELLEVLKATAEGIDIWAWAASVVEDPAAHGATPHEAKLVERLLRKADR